MTITVTPPSQRYLLAIWNHTSATYNGGWKNGSHHQLLEENCDALFVQVSRLIYKFHPVQIFGALIRWVNTPHYLSSSRGWPLIHDWCGWHTSIGLETKTLVLGPLLNRRNDLLIRNGSSIIWTHICVGEMDITNWITGTPSTNPSKQTCNRVVYVYMYIVVWL